MQHKDPQRGFTEGESRHPQEVKSALMLGAMLDGAFEAENQSAAISAL